MKLSYNNNQYDLLPIEAVKESIIFNQIMSEFRRLKSKKIRFVRPEGTLHATVVSSSFDILFIYEEKTNGHQCNHLAIILS